MKDSFHCSVPDLNIEDILDLTFGGDLSIVCL